MSWIQSPSNTACTELVNQRVRLAWRAPLACRRYKVAQTCSLAIICNPTDSCSHPGASSVSVHTLSCSLHDVMGFVSSTQATPVQNLGLHTSRRRTRRILWRIKKEQRRNNELQALDPQQQATLPRQEGGSFATFWTMAVVQLERSYLFKNLFIFWWVGT